MARWQRSSEIEIQLARQTRCGSRATECSSRDGSLTVLRRYARLAIVRAAGSIAGTVLGGLLLGVIPDAVLVPGLAALLVFSSIKVWRHATAR